MSFLQRAKSMHERGDSVRAAIILAEGLKREPEHGEALEWLLHLYVEELPNPGIERELLVILAGQPNGAELYEIVEAELDDLGRVEKIEALRRTAHREGVTFDAPGPEAPPEPAHAPQAEQAELPIADPERPTRERWDEFDSPLSRAPDSVQVPRADERPPTGPTPRLEPGTSRSGEWDPAPIAPADRQRVERRRRATVLALLGLLVVGVIAVLTLGRGDVENPLAEASGSASDNWTAPPDGSGP